MIGNQQCPHCEGVIASEQHAVNEWLDLQQNPMRLTYTYCEFCQVVREAAWRKEDDNWVLKTFVDYRKAADPVKFRKGLQLLAEAIKLTKAKQPVAA